MRFLNAIRSLIDNFSNVYKLLFCYVVVGVISFSVGYAIITVNLGVLLPEMKEVLNALKEFFVAVSSGNVEYLVGFHTVLTDALAHLWAAVQANVGSIIGSVIGLILIYLLAHFVIGLATFAMGSVVNDRMTQYSHTRFSAAFFSRLGQAALYQLVYVPLSFLFDAIALFISVMVWIVLLDFLPALASVALCVTSIVVLEALKFTVISSWMPAMVTEKKRVGQAMKEGFSNAKDFKRRYSSYLVFIYVGIILNAIFGIFTLGSGLLLSVPMTMLAFLCMQFVFYNEEKGIKYFVLQGKIVETKKDIND